MPYFEIRQILMGDPEVFTNLSFISISTLPFELRPNNSIKLDSRGKVVSPNPNYDADSAANISDGYGNLIPVQNIRSQLNLSPHQLMTGSQM